MANRKYKLTEKQRVFCHEYVKDWNATRSAKAAGYKVDNARQSGYELLTKPYIKEYIDLIKDDIAKEAGLSKLKLINELKLIAFSNLPLIAYKYQQGGIDALTEEEQKVILEIVDKKRQLGEDGVIIDKEQKIRLHDKRGAIQDILKAMGWNEPDKIDHSGSLTVQNVQLSKDEIKDIAKELEDEV